MFELLKTVHDLQDASIACGLWRHVAKNLLVFLFGGGYEDCELCVIWNDAG